MKTSRFPAFLRYLLLLVSTTFVLVAFGVSRRSDKEPQNPAECWLFLGAEAKREYVHGYLSGFYEGKRAACHFYEEQMTPYLAHEAVPPEKLPLHVCMSTLPEFTASSHYQVYADTYEVFQEISTRPPSRCSHDSRKNGDAARTQ